MAAHRRGAPAPRGACPASPSRALRVRQGSRRALREAGIAIESVAVAKPSLDEVFLALTGHDTNPADDAEILQEIR